VKIREVRIPAFRAILAPHARLCKGGAGSTCSNCSRGYARDAAPTNVIRCHKYTANINCTSFHMLSSHLGRRPERALQRIPSLGGWP